MAIEIKGIPVLTGEDARLFYEEAEKNSRLPNPILTKEQKEILHRMLNSSKGFSFPD